MRFPAFRAILFSTFVIALPVRTVRADAASDAAEKTYELTVAQARKDYDEKLAKARADLITALQAALDTAKTRGDQETVAAIRNRLTALTSETAVATPPQKSRTIDLLASVDTLHDSVKGTWMMKDGVLYSDMSRDATLQLPYRPPAEYDLKVEFTRQRGNNSVMQLLAAGESRFSFQLGDFSNTLAGFELIKGVGVDRNVTGVRGKAILTNGRRYVSLIKLRRDHVQAYLDGKLVSEWKTDYSDMTLVKAWELPDKRTLGLATWESSTAFSQVQVVEMTGVGELLREPKDPKRHK